MSKSVIYVVNTADQTLAVGNTINFGSIVRRYGCALTASGGNVIIRGAGYYDIDTNFTITPAAAGTLTIMLFKDGVAIPGAETTRTVAADTTYALTIPAIIRETCECESTITAVITGVAAEINNATILVEKM